MGEPVRTKREGASPSRTRCVVGKRGCESPAGGSHHGRRTVGLMWRVALVAAVWLPLCVARSGHAQQVSFTPTDTGFTLAVSGIEVGGLAEVDAVARAYSGASAGRAIQDQSLLGNRLEEYDVRSRSAIQDSFQDNRGIVNVNQSSGNLNNQANVRVLTLQDGAPGADAVLHELEGWGTARRQDNTLLSTGGAREARMTNSFGGTVGIVGVNQSAGSLNQQANVLVLGLGVSLEAGMASLGDSSLGEVNAGNSLTQGQAGSRADIISDSFLNFRGIAQVIQSSGDLNVVGNYLAVSTQVMNVR